GKHALVEVVAVGGLGDGPFGRHAGAQRGRRTGRAVAVEIDEPHGRIAGVVAIDHAIAVVVDAVAHLFSARVHAGQAIVAVFDDGEPVAIGILRGVVV